MLEVRPFAAPAVCACGIASEPLMRERGRLLRRRAFFSRCRRLSHAQRRDWLQLQWTPERENYRNRRVTPDYTAC
ncbi:MAG: hypothetical protein ACLFM0_02205 [Spirochaetales bacterium]